MGDNKTSPENEHPVKTFGYAARDPSGQLSPFKFSRRLTGEKDVRFKVLYCGICHTDLHVIRNDFGHTKYPVVPGHEITGEVTEVGKAVTKFKVGDRVGVGCYIGSCRSCEDCKNDLENYCVKPMYTYPGTYYDGTPCYGGYSNEFVADEHFVLRIPDKMPLDGAAPLLCAGITIYSPMMYYGLTKPGSHLGVVGIGGLGHVAVKFAKAFGLKVTAISTSERKRDEALKHLGADAFLVSKDPEQMKTAVKTMDGIIDTVSAPHEIMPLVALLKNHGKLILVGVPNKPLEISVFPMLVGRKMVGASGAGGLKETQEMLDFAAKHNISADIEVISMDYVNTAMDRLHAGDVKYRFVIDVGKTLAAV